MKIAIHPSKSDFSSDWIAYCEQQHISFKIIDCYSSTIVQDVEDCDIVLWHHHHTNAKDVLFAKGLLFALEQSGKIVFPNFNTAWHFDDKVGQKYLLEAIHAPIPKNYVFYDKLTALDWVGKVDFPKVFKLRGGAGSTNVKLIRTKKEARNIIRKAFNKGFKSYDKWGDLQRNFKSFKSNKDYVAVLKSIRRLFMSTQFEKTVGNEKGYAYFQEFIPDNDHDTRVIVIGNKAFAIKRMVNKGDFRASGSGIIEYDHSLINLDCIKVAFDVTKKMEGQCVAFDFVFDKNKAPLIVEINYGFAHKSYKECPGYWDENLQWHKGQFNSTHWIIDELVSKYILKK